MVGPCRGARSAPVPSCCVIPAGPVAPRRTSGPAGASGRAHAGAARPEGTGGSDRPTASSGYDLEDYAADIEAVREHLGLRRLDLLGHSHGGFVAMAWGGAYPDRVGRLVLAGTAPRFTDVIRRLRMERVGSHQGQHFFEDAIAPQQDQQAGNY